MAIPAEHYAEAERLLGLAANASDNTRPDLLTTAQIHATLATCPTWITADPADPRECPGLNPTETTTT